MLIYNKQVKTCIQKIQEKWVESSWVEFSWVEFSGWNLRGWNFRGWNLHGTMLPDCRPNYHTERQAIILGYNLNYRRKNILHTDDRILEVPGPLLGRLLGIGIGQRQIRCGPMRLYLKAQAMFVQAVDAPLLPPLSWVVVE